MTNLEKKIENKQRKVVIKRKKIWSFDICKRHNISRKKTAKLKKTTKIEIELIKDYQYRNLKKRKKLQVKIKIKIFYNLKNNYVYR